MAEDHKTHAAGRNTTRSGRERDYGGIGNNSVGDEVRSRSKASGANKARQGKDGIQGGGGLGNHNH